MSLKIPQLIAKYSYYAKVKLISGLINFLQLLIIPLVYKYRQNARVVVYSYLANKYTTYVIAGREITTNKKYVYSNKRLLCIYTETTYLEYLMMYYLVWIWLDDTTDTGGYIISEVYSAYINNPLLGKLTINMLKNYNLTVNSENVTGPPICFLDRLGTCDKHLDKVKDIHLYNVLFCNKHTTNNYYNDKGFVKNPNLNFRHQIGGITIGWSYVTNPTNRNLISYQLI